MAWPFSSCREVNVPTVDDKLPAVNLPRKTGKGDSGAKQQTSHPCFHAQKINEDQEPVKRAAEVSRKPRTF